MSLTYSLQSFEAPELPSMGSSSPLLELWFLSVLMWI